jgi:predicted ArsR family transcriptional regulator
MSECLTSCSASVHPRACRRCERKDGASISELAEPFTIKLPAVMKHLDVLTIVCLIGGDRRRRGALRQSYLFGLVRQPDNL